MLATAVLLCSALTISPPARLRTTSRWPGHISMSDEGPIYDPEVLKKCKEMDVRELKAELDLRAISYAGMFDKIELATALAEARSTGKADPSILDDFNRCIRSN
jgi:hypothetical protein